MWRLISRRSGSLHEEFRKFSPTTKTKPTWTDPSISCCLFCGSFYVSTRFLFLATSCTVANLVASSILENVTSQAYTFSEGEELCKTNGFDGLVQIQFQEEEDIILHNIARATGSYWTGVKYWNGQYRYRDGRIGMFSLSVVTWASLLTTSVWNSNSIETIHYRQLRMDSPILHSILCALSVRRIFPMVWISSWFNQ